MAISNDKYSIFKYTKCRCYTIFGFIIVAAVCIPWFLHILFGIEPDQDLGTTGKLCWLSDHIFIIPRVDQCSHVVCCLQRNVTMVRLLVCYDHSLSSGDCLIVSLYSIVYLSIHLWSAVLYLHCKLFWAGTVFFEPAVYMAHCCQSLGQELGTQAVNASILEQVSCTSPSIS